MSELDPIIYDFVFYIGGVMIIGWLVRIVCSYKQMHELARAVNARTTATLQELLATGERITAETVTALLRRKQRVLELPVTAWSVAACTGKVKLESRDGGDVLKVELCCRLPTAIDVFVSVPHTALRGLQAACDAVDGPGSSWGRGRRRRFSQQQISPNRLVARSLSSSSSSCFLAARDCEHHAAAAEQPTQSSTLSFRLPSATLRKAMQDAAVVPVVVVLTPSDPLFASPPPASSPISASAVELTALSHRQSRPLQQAAWLSAHPFPSTPSLSFVTLLSSSSPARVRPQLGVSGSYVMLSAGHGGAWRVEELYGTADGSDCVVCLSARRCVLLLPCRHLCLCLQCFHSVQQQRCPVCRSALKDHCVYQQTATVDEQERQHNDAAAD